MKFVSVYCSTCAHLPKRLHLVFPGGRCCCLGTALLPCWIFCSAANCQLQVEALILSLNSIQASRMCKGAAAAMMLRCNPVASDWLFAVVAWQLRASQEGSRAVCVKFFGFRLGAAAAVAALPPVQVSSFFSIPLQFFSSYSSDNSVADWDVNVIQSQLC